MICPCLWAAQQPRLSRSVLWCLGARKHFDTAMTQLWAPRLERARKLLVNNGIRKISSRNHVKDVAFYDVEMHIFIEGTQIHRLFSERAGSTHYLYQNWKAAYFAVFFQPPSRHSFFFFFSFHDPRALARLEGYKIWSAGSGTTSYNRSGHYVSDCRRWLFKAFVSLHLSRLGLNISQQYQSINKFTHLPTSRLGRERSSCS